jgi:transposase
VATTKENAAKRRAAYELYVNGDYSLQAISEMVGVSEQSVVNWSRKDGWVALKNSGRFNTEKIAQGIQKELLAMMARAEEADGPGFLNAQLQDARLKAVKAYKELEGDFSYGVAVKVVAQLLRWMANRHPEKAKLIAEPTKLFLMDLAQQFEFKGEKK